MKRFILLLLVLLLTVWVGSKIAADPGYILLAYKTWTVEMPLWMGAIILFIFIALTFFLVRLTYGSKAMMTRMRARANTRRIHRSHTQTNRGLIELAEGNWEEAEQYLLKGVKRSETPLINYLAVARAAQQMGAYDRRDSYLRLAHKSMPEAEVAVGLTQAQLQIDHKQLEQALATLCHMHDLMPKHHYVLKLLNQIYVNLQDWQNLKDLLPKLRKQRVLKPDELHALEQKVYSECLAQTIKSKNKNAIDSAWHDLSRDWQRDHQLLIQYIRYLIKNNQHADAEKLLQEAIKREWHDDYIELFGLITASDKDKQLATAESWLKKHSNNTVLLLCLGRLCRRQQLWGKARNYLEQCLKFNPTPEIYAELALAMEQLNEPGAASAYFRKGLLSQMDMAT